MMEHNRFSVKEYMELVERNGWTLIPAAVGVCDLCDDNYTKEELADDMAENYRAWLCARHARALNLCW